MFSDEKYSIIANNLHFICDTDIQNNMKSRLLFCFKSEMKIL